MRNVLIIAILTLLVMNSCSDLNSIHQEYLNRGEKIYLGKPDSLSYAVSGSNLKLYWKLTASPLIKSTVIYHNNRKDSVERSPIRINGPQKDSVIIQNLSKDIYTFELINKGDNGQRSFPSRIMVDLRN